MFSDPFVTLPGDYNGDGVVDAADYSVVAQELWRYDICSSPTETTTITSTTPTIPSGGRTLGKTWQDLAYGSGAGVANAPVPEPTAAALAVLASFCDARTPAP